jgi:predicted component of type VI protein secretion system
MHVLIVETGKHKGKRLKLPDGETVIGRDPDAQLRIASNEVSRRHCLLIAEGERLKVRDLGSSNGTFVNGTPIEEEYELQPGDLLVIGPMGFRFPGPASAEAATPPLAASPRKSPREKEQEKLSDDEIALWLADGSSDQLSSGDTAVLPVAGGAAHPAAQEPIVPPKKKVFRSVAEEAADIIRRHREALAAKNKEERGK